MTGVCGDAPVGTGVTPVLVPVLLYRLRDSDRLGVTCSTEVEREVEGVGVVGGEGFSGDVEVDPRSEREVEWDRRDGVRENAGRFLRVVRAKGDCDMRGGQGGVGVGVGGGGGGGGWARWIGQV